MEANYKGSSNVVSPVFQCILIFISTIILIFSFYHAFNTFSSSDIAPKIHIVTPQELIAFGSPSKVKAGLFIEQFQKFDMVKNQFIFAGSVWFMFAPGLISMSTLEKFGFARGQILYRSPPDTKLVGDQILVRYDVIVDFNSGVDFSYFPVDDHELYILLTHKFVSPHELLFESTQEEFIVASNMRNYGWKLMGKSTTAGYTANQLELNNQETFHSHPAVLFSIKYARTGFRYIITILLPLLLIFYLSLFSFSLDSKDAVSISVGSITAILAYRFVIETMSPPVGYFMLSDYLFLLILAATFTVFLISVIGSFLKNITLLQKKVVLCALHTIVSTITVFLFYVLV